MSVDSVPFDVTGDGPTMSLGLAIWAAGDNPASIELGRRDDSSVELRADLRLEVSS